VDAAYRKITCVCALKKLRGEKAAFLQAGVLLRRLCASDAKLETAFFA
jgi:hypothetical protein